MPQPELAYLETLGIIDGMNPRGSLVPLILQTLRSGPLHGYAIAQRIKSRSRGVLDFKEGSLYPALHSLQQKGWLESFEEEENGRTRRYYKLTRKGLAALEKEKAAWEEYSRAVHLVFEEA